MNYALVTSAKNEEAYIERTIQGVLAQTFRPVRWVIVDDGSTDRTGEISRRYARHNAWMTVLARAPGLSRSFASKAAAFSAACRLLEGVRYEYLGNLDADISLPPGYYQQLFGFFDADPSLGIAGGRCCDVGENGRIRPMKNSPDNVRGAVQMFRRECFSDVGGYLPLPLGGIDSAAEILARHRGWRVQEFADLAVLHLRPTGGTGRIPLSSHVRRGLQDRSLGYGGLFEAARCGARIGERPYLLGGLCVLLGFFWGWVRGDTPVLPGSDGQLSPPGAAGQDDGTKGGPAIMMPLVVALCTGLLALALYFPAAHLVMRILRRAYSRRLRRFNRNVCLTFDDGPDPVRTPAILETLRAHHVRATFFVLGDKCAAHPDILAAIAHEGHEIGDHGRAHLHPWKTTPWDYFRDLVSGDAMVRPALNGRMRGLFRPPYGKANALTFVFAWLFRKALVFWNVDPHDYKSEAASEAISEVLGQVRRTRGAAVVLLHDGRTGDWQRGAGVTAAVVDFVCPRLSEQGYEFLTVSELMAKR